MNIESVNVSPLASSSVSVESPSSPLNDGGVISEGFSGALVAQIELLSDIKIEGLLTTQVPDLTVSQGVNGLQSVADVAVSTVNVQDFAALLGNDLPLSYKIKDNVDNEAALAAVTDTLNYIAMGTTAGEKAAEAEKNMKDVIAMAAVSVEQDMAATVVEGEQNTAAMVVETKQNTAAMAVETKQNTAAMAVETKQNTVAVEAKQNTAAMADEAQQNMVAMTAEAEQDMNDAVVMDTSVQMDSKQTNDKPDKTRTEDETQAGAEANSGTLGLLTAMILPAVSSAEQGKAVNDFVAADAIKGDMLSSFIKPSAGDAKPNQSTKAANNELSSPNVFVRSAQNKQAFNLKYAEGAGLAENAGRVKQQILNFEGEKTLPRVGADINTLNRLVVDNKTDVPAMTKPLSHPEWNKDLGERIVWMSSKAIPSAEIRLNPEHLGPISVRVNVTDEHQATVVFTAQHATTREALEAAVPKLREMMGAQQLNLVEVNVSQGAASDQGRSQSQNFAQTADGRGQGATDIVADGVDDVEQEIESGRAIVSKGLLSIYA
jgi:flagellar hook-length control protein FliK